MYQGSDLALIELMSHMLQFIPQHRISFTQALQHRYFDRVREPSREVNAEVPADFEFEDVKDITADELRRLFISEIQRHSRT
jgi:hypothetical protein